MMVHLPFFNHTLPLFIPHLILRPKHYTISYIVRSSSRLINQNPFTNYCGGIERKHIVVEDLVELSGQTDPNEYMKFFVTQQIADQNEFIARMGPEVNTIRNQMGQWDAIIVGLEALENVGSVWDNLMSLRRDQRKPVEKMVNMQHWLTVEEEDIEEKQKLLKK